MYKKTSIFLCYSFLIFSCEEKKIVSNFDVHNKKICIDQSVRQSPDTTDDEWDQHRRIFDAAHLDTQQALLQSRLQSRIAGEQAVQSANELNDALEKLLEQRKRDRRSSSLVTIEFKDVFEQRLHALSTDSERILSRENSTAARALQPNILYGTDALRIIDQENYDEQLVCMSNKKDFTISDDYDDNSILKKIIGSCHIS